MLTYIHGIGTGGEIVNEIDVQILVFIPAKMFFTQNVWEGAKSIFLAKIWTSYKL
jgi:hypothetical protein